MRPADCTRSSILPVVAEPDWLPLPWRQRHSPQPGEDVMVTVTQALRDSISTRSIIVTPLEYSMQFAPTLDPRWQTAS